MSFSLQCHIHNPFREFDRSAVEVEVHAGTTEKYVFLLNGSSSQALMLCGFIPPNSLYMEYVHSMSSIVIVDYLPWMMALYDMFILG